MIERRRKKEREAGVNLSRREISFPLSLRISLSSQAFAPSMWLPTHSGDLEEERTRTERRRRGETERGREGERDTETERQRDRERERGR